MTAPVRHLHIVDRDSGEVLDGCPACAAREDEIKGLQRALKAEIRRYENLLRDKEAEARADQNWPKAMAIFAAWKQATGHKKSVFKADRFFLIEPFLRKPEYGLEVCVRAVAGVAYDHFTAPRKNGTVQHFDEWERVFRDAGQVERFANAAPLDWRQDPIFAPLLQVESRDKAARQRVNAPGPTPKE